MQCLFVCLLALRVSPHGHPILELAKIIISNSAAAWLLSADRQFPPTVGVRSILFGRLLPAGVELLWRPLADLARCASCR
jgi:hypothetical protein